jgi:hypothetical protein
MTEYSNQEGLRGMERFVHVIPLDDVIAHEETPRSVCGPGCEAVTAVDLGEPAAAADRIALGWPAPAVGLIYHHYALQPCHRWEAVPEP